MAFKVIDDKRAAYDLWKAGLLWYRAPQHHILDWRHPMPSWRAPLADNLYTGVEEYAILVED